MLSRVERIELLNPIANQINASTTLFSMKQFGLIK